MRKSAFYPLAAGLALALAWGAPAGAEPADPESPEASEQQRRDEERLDSLEQEVLILQRKLEVQEEDAAKKATKTPIVGAGPDGFYLRSPDSKFQIKLRGYAQFDSRWLVQSEDAGDDTFLFRRVRPFVEGTLFEHIDFRIMPDFAGSTLTLFDAYVNLRYLTQFQVQGGKFKPPLGLERLQSATALMLIERGFPTLLVPSRDLGGMIHGEFANGFFAYQVGGFNGVRDGGTQDVDTDDGKDVVGRVFLHPFRPLENDWVDGFGIGAAGSWGRIDEQTLTSFRTTAAAVNFFSYRTTVGGLALAGEGERIRWSPQAYWYVGPLGLLAEYVSSEQEIKAGNVKANPRTVAWQVEASFALTGEDASYKGLIPAQPFNPFTGTWGAFEVAGRYHEIDFDNELFPAFADPSASASKARGYIAGLNWYLNRWVKVMANFDRTWFDGGAPGGRHRPSENTILTRLQLSY